jgi:hypothetical protein
VAETAPLRVQLIAKTDFLVPPDVPWSTDADGGPALVEFAGRACYQSWSKPNPKTATNAAYLRHIIDVGHFSGARARVGDVLHHGYLAIVHARADPPSALLVFAALTAVCPRARLAGRSCRLAWRTMQELQEIFKTAATPAGRRTPSYSPRLEAEARRPAERGAADASRRGRPRAQCCRTPPRHASS